MKKKCKKCGKELPIEDFAHNYRSKDGRMHTCMSCWNDARSAGMKAYYEKEKQVNISHSDEVETIDEANESLGKTIAESKEQDEKIHALTLKALELFDDGSIIQALRDRGYVGEIYKKITL